MTTVQMPQLGETVVEGTILKWLKQEGEQVARDEPLFEISTDKVDTEVPSPEAGTLMKILVPEGQTVGVGTPLAEIEAGDGQAAPAQAADHVPAEEAPAAPAPAKEAAEQPAAAEPSREAPAETPQVEPGTPGEPPTGVAAQAMEVTQPTTPPEAGPRSQILSPLVRRLAQDNDVDLSQVQGSGTGGRITKNDVLAFVSARRAEAPAAPAAPAPAPEAAPAPAAAPAMAPAEAPTVPAAAAAAGEDVQPISHIRRAIGEHMLASTQQTARAWTLVEVNVDHLVKVRERAKEDFERKHGVKLTYLPFVVRATVEALQTYSQVNARLDGDNVVTPRYVNMGIAVSYDAGLIVPVVKNADAMNSVGIARAIADLAARARAHQLKPDEVHGATFTITNPGPYGSVASVPIINQPNTGILSLDAIVKRPVVIDDAIAIRSMVNVSMSWDHRTIDGEIATRFLARVKQNLESWDFAEDVGL